MACSVFSEFECIQVEASPSALPATQTFTMMIPPDTQAVAPEIQTALLLHAPRTPYVLTTSHPLPLILHPNEVRIRITHIGLNPIDWKSADYGFGLPVLPAVNGRDLAGVVVAVGEDHDCKIQLEPTDAEPPRKLRIGDRVFGPSTQYRDSRTSAFQSYAVTQSHCLGVVPPTVESADACAIGVGAVTAMLALGSSLGVALGGDQDCGFRTRDVAVGAEGEDIRWGRVQERNGLDDVDALIAQASGMAIKSVAPITYVGEWLLIWGASAVTGFFAAQFAIMAGMRVIAVVDAHHHGDRLRAVGIEHIIERASPIEAVSKIRALTNGELRYAIDCVGKTTAQFSIDALDQTPSQQTYIVGLTGLPKEAPENVKLCTVPIKTFHTNPRVGAGLMRILEDLLAQKKLVLPPVEVVEGGLGAINGALDRLRRGEVGGGRLVVHSGADGIDTATATAIPDGNTPLPNSSQATSRNPYRVSLWTAAMREK